MVSIILSWQNLVNFHIESEGRKEVNKRKEKTLKFNVIQILIVKQRFSLF